jgi:Spy/CpxP family protein refolding chaperone
MDYMTLKCKDFVFAALTALSFTLATPAIAQSQSNQDPGAELPMPAAQQDMPPDTVGNQGFKERGKRWQQRGSGVRQGQFGERWQQRSGFRQGQFPAEKGLGNVSMGGRHALDLTPLNLTEQQKEKIQQAREQTKIKMKEVRRSLIQKQMEVRSLMFSPDSTEAQIRKARKDLRQFQDQIDELTTNDLLSIRSTLTEEQRKHLPELLPSNRAKSSPTQNLGPHNE